MNRLKEFSLSLTGALIILLIAGLSVAGANSPTPAEQGNAIFQQRCSTCHGDRGQGLAEWRLTWDDQHQNCSQAKCHGLAHPPEGFYLPNNYAPKIIGEDTLLGFKTAQELYNFVSKRMPYHAPGSLTSDEYWKIVSFLTHEHVAGVDDVNPSNASSIGLHGKPVPPPSTPATIGQNLPTMNSAPTMGSSQPATDSHPTDNIPMMLGVAAVLAALAVLSIGGTLVWHRRARQR